MAEDPGVGPFADLLSLRRSMMADGRARFELVVRPEGERCATLSFYIQTSR